MGRGNPSPGKGLRGTPGATFMASLLACYTRNRRPSALSPTSGREDKKRLVYMVRLARNLTSECLGGLPSKPRPADSALCRSTWPWREGSGERSSTREGIQSVER
jgi:hypothetical protein